MAGTHVYDTPCSSVYFKRMHERFRAAARHLELLVREGSLLVSTAFKLDVASCMLCAAFLVAALPLVPRDTDDAQRLAAFVNDEPPLTMALEAMTVPPYGNPANFYYPPGAGPAPLPEHWGNIAYTGGFFYYGGAYFIPAFAVFAPLHWLGVPTFPAAPIILRLISALAGCLSLLALYNLTRPYANKPGALVAAAVLLLDVSFLYYSTIIHPDTLQLLLGLLAVHAAARHARDGGIHTLIVLGVLCGLVQGTKFGGPWTLPMGLVAAYWGLQASTRHVSAGTAGYRLLAQRMLMLGMAAIAAYAISTPYAFLDSYYIKSLSGAYSVVFAMPPFERIGFTQWLTAVHASLGSTLSVAGAIALLWGIGRIARRPEEPAFGAAAILAVSQILWYATLGKLWVSVGYLMVAEALAAFLFVSLSYRLLSRTPRFVAQGVFIVGFVALVAAKAGQGAEYIVRQYTHDCTTLVEINRWASSGGIPRGRKILYDDTAYFDPRVYPDAHTHGGILTWPALKLHQPDYLVLSGSLFAAPHMVKLFASQKLNRDDPSGWSVRLYQDLLQTTVPGATADPSVEFVKRIRPTADDPQSFCTARSTVKSSPVRWHAFKWLMAMLPGIAGEIDNVVYLAENASGIRNDLFGPEMRIYRYFGPKIVPITDGTLTGYNPRQPFFGLGGAAWISSKKGKKAVGSYIGVDFGAHPTAYRQISIRWVLPYSTPVKARLEYSDDGVAWNGAQLFDVDLPADSPAYSQTTILDVSRFGARRYWRLVAVEMKNDSDFFGVSRMEFIE